MIDLLLFAVIAGSLVLGLLRGLVGTLVSTAAWLLAGWAAFRFGEQAAFWFSKDGTPSPAELFGGYVSTFVVVMVAVTLIGALIKSTVKSIGLSTVDRFFGLLLGLLRGAFLACLLVLLMGFTPIPKEDSWKHSLIVPLLLPAAEWMHSKLPDWSVPESDSRSPAATGDNDAPSGLPEPLLQAAVQHVVGSARERMSKETSASQPSPAAEPVNIEPAPSPEQPTAGQTRPNTQ